MISVLRIHRIIVGAPRDNITSTKLVAKGLESPGTVYRCGVTQGSQCEPIIVDEGEYSLALHVQFVSLLLMHLHTFQILFTLTSWTAI